jgi:hypothetical protein
MRTSSVDSFEEDSMGGKSSSLKRGTGVTVVAIALAMLTMISIASAQVRRLVPEESPSGPFYARLERGMVLQTADWVAIAFYREPTCVRPQFNLLNFFDFANIPAIFACPLTVHGFELWRDPASDPAPRQGKFQGNGAVPIWFVSAADFQAALPGITLTELLAMPSLMQGVATNFEETLHPLGGATQSMLQIVASGSLPDGRTFQFVAVEASGTLRHVRIEFQ